MTHISGSYPGGPRRGADAVGEKRAEAPPRVERLEQREERLHRASRGRNRRLRYLRVWSRLVLALALSAGFGLYFGYRTHLRSEDITAARNAARQRPVDASSEINRVMLELWKMEDVEKQPAPP